jgi:hypothetical protein
MQYVSINTTINGQQATKLGWRLAGVDLLNPGTTIKVHYEYLTGTNAFIEDGNLFLDYTLPPVAIAAIVSDIQEAISDTILSGVLLLLPYGSNEYRCAYQVAASVEDEFLTIYGDYLSDVQEDIKNLILEELALEITTGFPYTFPLTLS